MQNNASSIDLLHLATALHGGSPDEVVRLPGGRNNVVAQVRAAGKQWLLKVYFSHPNDRRDRLGAEFGMLQFLHANGVDCVPRPVVARADLRAALYEFVEGARLAPENVTHDDATQLAALLGRMWRAKNRQGSERLPPASDSHFTLASCLDSLDRRMDRLRENAPPDVGAFVKADLAAALKSLKSFVAARTRDWSLPLDRELPQAERTLTPADHGFQNAIRRNDGRLVFLDFEYAGWDDPAQMVANAWLQPGVPMPIEHRENFVRNVMGQLGADVFMWRRLGVVHPLMAFKWALIMLNEFVPVADSRRKFAGKPPAARRDEQLTKSRAQLHLVRQAMTEGNWLDALIRSEHVAAVS